MNPNDEQQKLYQMFSQMNGQMPDPYRMMQMPGYYPYWPPQFPNALNMMPPKPFDTKYFPDGFMPELHLGGQAMGQQAMGIPPGFAGMPNPLQAAMPPGMAAQMGHMMPHSMGINPFEMQFKQPPQPPPMPPQPPAQVVPPVQAPVPTPAPPPPAASQAPAAPPQSATPNQQSLEQSFSQIVNEFQLKILNMFVVQNQMLLEFKNKNQVLETTITSILDEITNLQKIVEQKFDTNNDGDNFGSKLSLPQQVEHTSNHQLVKALFGETDFQYQLVLANDLEVPLFKDKNFNLELVLKDMKGSPYKNAQKIELEVALYSSDDKPIPLTVNSQNQPILRQLDQQIYLIDGEAHIEKLQINEVTSHYQNGWIYLIVFAIKEEKQLMSIKPLIIQVMVKSKKTIKKQQLGVTSSRSRSRSQEKLRRLEQLNSSSNDEKQEEIYQHDSES